MKSQIFPGLFLYLYMEVGILEKYRGNPLPLLEGGSDGDALTGLAIVHWIGCINAIKILIRYQH